MKKINKVLPVALAVTFSFLGPVTHFSNANVSYAELSYRNNLLRYISEYSEYRQSDVYKNALDAKKIIYKISIAYAKDLVNNESASEDQYKSAAQEIADIKRDIEDTTNPLEEKAKVRAGLKIQLYPAKELVYNSYVGDYNQKEYDNLSKAYAKALNVYENTESTETELREALTNLKNASDIFVKESNRKVRIIDLENSIKNNKIQIEAAENLLKNYPNTVKNVSEKLKGLINDSKALITEAETVLSELRK